jgi:hypothetical protein
VSAAGLVVWVLLFAPSAPLAGKRDSVLVYASEAGCRKQADLLNAASQPAGTGSWGCARKQVLP